MQPAKATEGSSEKGDTHTQAKPTQSPRKPQYIQRRRPRGSKEREDTHTREKPTQSQENHSTSNEGDRGGAKRGKTHTLKQKNMTTVQPTKATEGNTLEATKKDKNEKSHQQPYQYGHLHPIGAGKNGACAEIEIA